MAEYIEREAARSVVCDVCELCGSLYCTYDCKHPIDAIPAADVVPVVHGRWFLDGDYEYINCSECLYPFYMGFDTSSDARQYLASEERWKYCPNCGARMDGDRDV